ncbi:MAG: hypothetical protein JWR80_3003 [Bradyrhizobium sp.]|nr:hypothetical protein [Bradyrhizobium sp.]
MTASDPDTTAPPCPPLEEAPERTFARDVLAYFYPVHYRMGMEMEQAMSLGRVDRKQAAMLWLIHSRTTGGGWLRRKEVEAELLGWFDISNSKISRIMGDLSRGPMKLIESAETPDSGREKMLRLTSEGQTFVEDMIDAAVELLKTKMGDVSLDEQRFGLAFFERAFRYFRA